MIVYNRIWEVWNWNAGAQNWCLLIAFLLKDLGNLASLAEAQNLRFDDPFFFLSLKDLGNLSLA